MGALIIAVDVNQPAAEFEDGPAEPGTSEVRIRFEQPLRVSGRPKERHSGRDVDHNM